VNRRARVGTLIAIFAAIAASVGVAAPVRAQTATFATTLALVGQDPSTPLGGTATLLLQTSGPVDGLSLVLTVHDRLTTRSGFDATIANANPSYPETRQLLRRSLDEYPPDSLGIRSVPLDVVRDLRVRPSGNGVYPVEVQLRDANDTTVTGFVTHVIVTDPSSSPKPLSVAWVWPLVADPVFAPDGSADPAVVSQLGSDGRLGRQALALGADADVPVTIAPSPETLESWSALATSDVDLAVGVAALQGAAAHHQVLSGPFVPLDMPSLTANGFTGVIGTELQRGAEALKTFFGTDFYASTAMPGPLDANALTVLRDAGRTRLVVDGIALQPFTGRLSAARPAQLAVRADDPTNTVRLLATDASVERHLTGSDPPALRAERLLAELTVIHGELPSVTRGIAFANPESWNPSDQFVGAVLQGLRGNPLLRPVTADTMLAEVPEQTVDDATSNPLVRNLSPVSVRKPPVRTTQYYEALKAREGIADLFDAQDARVVRADRSLLTSLTAAWEKPAGRARARALLAAIGQSGRDFLSRIQVPLKSTVTITASNAQIPLTFRNDADRAVKVHVALDSDKLLFPEGSARDVDLAPGKNHTVRIAVETRSSGTYPLTMTVTTAGGLPITTSEVTVRSSFVSGVGVFLTVGAIVFLALWWAWDIRRRRRRRQTA
jgi:Family of unknown function (DUF6049)